MTPQETHLEIAAQLNEPFDGPFELNRHAGPFFRDAFKLAANALCDFPGIAELTANFGDCLGSAGGLVGHNARGPT